MHRFFDKNKKGARRTVGVLRNVVWNDRDRQALSPSAAADFLVSVYGYFGAVTVGHYDVDSSCEACSVAVGYLVAPVALIEPAPIVMSASPEPAITSSTPAESPSRHSITDALTISPVALFMSRAATR